MTKEEKRIRRGQKIKEWSGIFTRAYEMNRAYGSSAHVAFKRASLELVNKMRAEKRKCQPSDVMFLVSCKIEVESMLNSIANEIERTVVHA